MFKIICQNPFDFGIGGVVVCSLMMWLVWSQTNQEVVDSWLESGTVEETVEHEKHSGFLRGHVTSRTFYIADIRTSDGDLVRVPSSKRLRTGKRVKVEWLEYDDGSVAAQLAQ